MASVPIELLLRIEGAATGAGGEADLGGFVIAPQEAKPLKLLKLGKLIRAVRMIRLARTARRGSVQTLFSILDWTPLLFTAKPNQKSDGTFSVTMKFNTVFINGKFGTPRFPRALKGMIKSVKTRDKVVKYVRKMVPPAHHLHQAGWTKLPIAKYELAAEIAVPS